MRSYYSYNSSSFFFSWAALGVFLFLVIFQPAKWTFFAIRPSDVWLLLSVLCQYIKGKPDNCRFRGRWLVKNFGIYVGIIAIIATIVQANHSQIYLADSFIFHFYRFFRFFLIFFFVENIVNYTGIVKSGSFLFFYTFLGVIVLIMAFLEYNAVQPFQLTIISFYYQRPENTLIDYLHHIERVAGVLGNSNATAIFLASTLAFPFAMVVKRIGINFSKVFFLSYILFVLFSLLSILGSRTAVFSIFIIPIIFLSNVFGNKRKLIKFTAALGIVLIIGLFIYEKFDFESKIQNRITSALKGEGLDRSALGIGKWTGRYNLWSDRLTTFSKEGNNLKEFIGMGYTKAFYDYADNGFISAYLNNGLIGLGLKLLLFYFFFKALFKWIRKTNSYSFYCSIVFPVVTLVLMMFELTADLVEHYKLGQIFYVFLSVSFFVFNLDEL